MPDNKAIRTMFGMEMLPAIPLSLVDISLKAQDMVGHMSISGVQPKLSLQLNKSQARLEPVAQGGEYILKPSQQTYAHIPENENCCMDIALELGIEVPPHCLIPLQDGTPAYVVKRFDRDRGDKIPTETLYQILGGQDKYAVSIEAIGKKLGEISAVPGLDVQLFFERVVLDFVIGNGDGHSKNVSILSKHDAIRLAPAYDLVSTRLVIPNDGDLALTLRGKKSNLERDDFDALADSFEIPKKVRFASFEHALSRIERVVRSSQLPDAAKDALVSLVRSRYQRLRLEP
jgi:serine/threonine-protein kinase HipA